MKVTVAGTGYVGLVTGVCLAEKGHEVTCYDIDKSKIEKLNSGESPIYEPGLEELIQKNLLKSKICFTSNLKMAYSNKDIIIIAVGTPELPDGSANLTYIENVIKDISSIVSKDIVVVTKSTVPVGTNDRILGWLENYSSKRVKIDVVSCPEFLREGSAVFDTFNGDRIVIGSNSTEAGDKVEQLYKNFSIPIVRTDIRSAEMIKYASNAFLATKISFINEIANICEKVGANIEFVADGIGRDRRIGNQFLKAGIGYGGSCFPKDTKALVQVAGMVEHKFELLESVIKVNNLQQLKLIDKAVELMGTLKDKRIALLGLAFKPNTDDVRESAAIVMAYELLKKEANVIAYDPVASENMKKVLGSRIGYSDSIEDALYGADIAFIVTEWQEIKDFPIENYKKFMKEPVLFDGRNIYDLNAIPGWMKYFSIGRKHIL